MSDDKNSKRVQELLKQCSQLITDGKWEDGASALREASSIDPNNDEVKSAWDRLKEEQSKSDIVQLCNEFNVYKDDKSAQKILEAIKIGAFSEEGATSSFTVLFSRKDGESASARDKVVSSLCLTKHGGKSLAKSLRKRPTEAFRDIWAVGPDSLDSLVQVLAKPELWLAQDDRASATTDVFILLLAQCLSINTEAPEAVMRSMARLMALNASAIEASIDDENLAIILSFMDIERSVELRSQATLTIARFLEVSPERAQSLLKDYIISRFRNKKSRTNDDLVASISVAGAIFPIVPEFSAGMFLAPDFTEDLVTVASISHSSRIRQATLELLSASCIDKNCREAVRKHCLPWLDELIKSDSDDCETAMAGLVLSKIHQESFSSATATKNNEIEKTLNELIPVFKNLSTHTGEPEMRTSVEALAYNSVHSSIKEELANDSEFLNNLVRDLGTPSSKGPLLFGGLTILSNLTSYQPVMSAEAKRMEQLKAYANQTRFTEPGRLDDDGHVTKRCQRVLDANVVPMLVQATRQASPIILNLISSIFLSLSKERSHCGTMAQQGVFEPILRLAHVDEKRNGNGSLPQVRQQAAQALARLLIPLDPNLVFSRDTGIAQKCVGTMKFLLDNSSDSDPYMAFDALRALTNLGSYNEDSARLITDTCFHQIATYLTSTRSALQQAATECICNLSESPYSMFKAVIIPINEKPYNPYPADFDIDKPSADQRSVVLLRMIWLTAEKARGTRLAAMAALASITSFEDGIEMLIHAPRGLEHIIGALEDAQSVESGEALGHQGKDAEFGDVDMRLRTITVLRNVICLLKVGDAHKKLVELGIVDLIKQSSNTLPRDGVARASFLQVTEQLEEVFRTIASQSSK